MRKRLGSGRLAAVAGEGMATFSSYPIPRAPASRTARGSWLPSFPSSAWECPWEGSSASQAGVSGGGSAHRPADTPSPRSRASPAMAFPSGTWERGGKSALRCSMFDVRCSMFSPAQRRWNSGHAPGPSKRLRRAEHRTSNIEHRTSNASALIALPPSRFPSRRCPRAHSAAANVAATRSAHRSRDLCPESRRTQRASPKSPRTHGQTRQRTGRALRGQRRALQPDARRLDRKSVV